MPAASVLEEASTAVLVAAIVTLTPPLMDGVRRKIFALIQRRIGPPVHQTWLDILKLFSRRATSPSTTSILYYASPALSLCLAILASLMIAVPWLDHALGGVFGFIILIEASVATVAAGVTGLTPYTSTGSSRLLLLSSIGAFGSMLALYSVCLSKSTEPLLHQALHAAPPALACLCFASLVLAGLIEAETPPFNVAEAGAEIAAGPYTEYHGPLLALAMISSFSRGFLLILAGAAVVVGYRFYNPAVNILAWAAASCATYALASIISGLFGRPKPLRASGLAVASLVAGAFSLAIVILSL